MALPDVYKPVSCSCEWKVTGIGLACGNSTNWINGSVKLLNELSGHHWNWFIKLYHKVKPDTEKHKIKLESGGINKLIETRNGQMGLAICLEKSGTNIRIMRPHSLFAYKGLYDRLQILKQNYPSPIPPNVSVRRSLVLSPSPQKSLPSTPGTNSKVNSERKRSVSDGNMPNETPPQRKIAEVSPHVREQHSSSLPPKKSYLMSALKKSNDSLSDTKGANSFYKTSSSGWDHNLIASSRSLSGSVPRKPGLLHGSKSVDYSWAKLKATSPFKDRSSSAKLQGFSNLGNTCYMNAILQSLFSLDSFSGDLIRSARLLDKHSSKLQNKGNLLRALSRLLRANQNCVSSDQKASLLHVIKRAISNSAKRFLGHEQHDAHEFLCQILDQLKEEIISLNKEFREIQEMEENAAVPQSDVSKLSNPTIENFECEVLHSISCLGCGEVLTKCESFNDLSLELPRQTVLIIHLKRYAFSAARQGKLGRSIKIPRFLTLSHLCGDVKDPSVPEPLPKDDLLKSSPTTLIDQENDPLLIESPKSPKQRFSFKRLSKSPIIIDDMDSSPISAKKSRPESAKTIRVNRPLMFPDAEYRLECSEDEQLRMALEASMTNSPDANLRGQVDGIFDDQEIEKKVKFKVQEGSSPAVSAGNAEKSDKSPEAKQAGDREDNIWSVSPKAEPSKWTEDNKELPEYDSMNLAIEESRKQQETEEEKFQAELERVKEMSLMGSYEMHTNLIENLSLFFAELYAPTLSTDFNEEEEAGPLEEINLEINKSMQEQINANSETGDLPHSFQLISVVSHFGSSSVGHYISDVYNLTKNCWLSCDDSSIKSISEADVFSKRIRTGYIFFYVNKEIFTSMAEESSKESLKMPSRVLHSQGNNNQTR
uniref:Ubiquitin carboxyl-terminal hydrolase n=1 Tax=Capitella teleta TaxID=283909 RepID=X2AX39_CAPTE